VVGGQLQRDQTGATPLIVVDRNKRTLPEQLHSSREYFQSIANEQAKAELVRHNISSICV